MSSNSEHSAFEPIMRSVTGYWSTSVIGAGVSLAIFEHIESGATTIDALSRSTSLSTRTTRALLDALTGLGLLTVKNCVYSNSAAASTFLIKGKDTYAGEFVLLNVETMPKWQGFLQAIQDNRPVMTLQGIPEHPYWDRLVNAVAGMSVPAARAAANDLNIDMAGPTRLLDVGGGAGVFCQVFLQLNRNLQATQIDWANVNRIAQQNMNQHGLGHRFTTIDGDMLTTELESDTYDIIVYSHMAHAFTPEENYHMFSKFRRALRDNGTLILNEFLVNDDGTAHPFVLLFSANIIFHAKNGSGWREGEYRAWLRESGFSDIRIKPTADPATLIYAK